ncbi:hypothetical protein ACFPPE_07295 [Agromyces tardus]|uniref:hypothetical protein n=1 Tax=Agromyces tardus TaxID=2583849 RepID=UPI00360DF685
MATLTLGGDDVQVQEWAAILGALGAGGGITAFVGGMFGRKGTKLDNLGKLEKIATGIAERATADADRRVAGIEKEFAAHKAETAASVARRREAAAAHAVWDEQVAVKLRELGAEVSAPPSLEGVHL